MSLEQATPTVPGGHVPVLVDEILQLFAAQSGDCLLDATVGLGGHAKAYLEATGPGGQVVGLDADLQALAQAARVLADYQNRVTLIVSNFAQLKDSALGGGIVHTPFFGQELPARESFSHILFDLGLGSHQLSDPTRGFSFGSEAGLTMRYGNQTGLPPSLLQPLNYLEQRLGYLPDAADMIARLKAPELALILKTYGEERYVQRIADAIKRQQPQTAVQLAEAVVEAVPKGYERGRIHPATRTFQAFRLAVNRELETVAFALPQAIELLQPGGVLAIISFHSLEDRIVKLCFKDQEKQSAVTQLTKRPITATAAEVAINRRSRSAKLRAVRKKE